MDDSVPARFDETAATATLERELDLVVDAVNAVARGPFLSVTVAGIRFGDELLPRARALAEGRGLRVRPLFRPDEHGADLVVERPVEIDADG
jgi:hypothetical protein